MTTASSASRCRSCQAAIIWTRTERGKKMPLDAASVCDAIAETRSLFVLRETDQPTPLAISAWGLEGTEPHYRSHFDTCTKSARADSAPKAPGDPLGKLNQREEPAANRPRFVMVAGSREWDAYLPILDALRQYADRGISVLHGDAMGADTLAEKACRELGLNTYAFPPDYGRFGKDAPHVRNDEMLKQADCVIAFWNGKSRGTKSVIDKARKRGIEVDVVYA